MRTQHIWLAFLCVAAGSATTIKPSKGALIQHQNHARQHLEEDRTITKVVKMLQGLLDKSKAEADEERTIYAKFKCYCDQSEEEKKAEIESLTEEIGMLESSIAQLQGETGALSSESAKIRADITANEAARNEATAIRGKEHEAFIAMETDMTAAIGTMGQAIDTLSAIGADQTLNAAADHKKFMAGYDNTALLRIKEQVNTALVAAGSFISQKQTKALQTFLQADGFNGNYASQSGAIVGVLRQLKETFEGNLQSAQQNEAASVQAYDAFIKSKTDEYDDLNEAYEQKQRAMGGNDDALASKKQQLETAVENKASSEEFLDQLVPMCEAKAKDYERRNMLRATEQSAISEAIAILNSDAAFATFGKVDATSTGGTGPAFFLQMRSSRKRVSQGHLKIQQFLQQAAAAQKSDKLAKVAALVKANNPFTVVLEEIDKMIALIAEEGEADQQNLDWCDSERNGNNEQLQARTEEITQLNTDITDLDNQINEPETGLKAQIQSTETSLVENSESQKTQTATRKEENEAYQKDAYNLASSVHLLKKAIKALTKYYDELAAQNAAAAGPSLLQKKKEEPAPPATWEEGSYAGQSEGGNQVIQMLQFILSEAEAEETAAHTSEDEAQSAYEESMATLKEEEATLQESLATLKETLAETERTLIEKKADLERTEAQKKAIENYLLEIKPGCDFITTNFDIRESHRATEKASLEEAKEIIKGTPAYQAAASAPASAPA